MKKVILGLVAASVIAAPAAAAPSYGHNNDRGRHEQVQRNDKPTKIVKVQRTRQVVSRNRQAVRYDWHRGQRFDSRYARNYAVIHNPRAYGLYNAPRGYQWVRSDNDAILVGLAGGIIGAVIASAL